jgi:hypothetical protein
MFATPSTMPIVHPRLQSALAHFLRGLMMWRLAVQGSMVLMVALVATPHPATSQPSEIGYHVWIPLEPIKYQGLGAPESNTTFLRLRWNHQPKLGTDPLLQEGMVVERVGRIGGVSGTEISFPYTLAAADLVTKTDTDAPRAPGSRATIYPDKTDPSRLHVNFWLSNKPFTWQDSDGQTHVLSPEALRDVQFYYKLSNRQTVTFPTRSYSIGAVTIPYRFRKGYQAANGREIPSSFAPTTSIALYGGRTIGSARYTYLRHAETHAVQRRYAVTVGGFFGLGSMDIDSTVARSAEEPVTTKTSVAVLSGGLAGLLHVRGLEMGVLVGVDRARWGAGKDWDHNRRLWVGLGLGFNIWKL